jgi:hypothetical protein
MIMGSESKGDYGLASVLGDNAGLTAGAYQFTERSGSLGKMLEKYNDLASKQGVTTLDPELLSAAKSGKMSSREQARVANFVRTQSQDESTKDIMKEAQDTTFNNIYLNPALKMAQDAGITDKSAAAMFADHYLNAGPGGAKRLLNIMKQNGITDFSKVSVDDIANARREDYKGIVERDPSKAKFLKGWNNRVDENASKLSDASTGMPQTTPDVSTEQPTMEIVHKIPSASITESQSEGRLPTIPSTPEQIDVDELAKKTGQEVAKAIAEQQAKQPIIPTVVKSEGIRMKQFSMDDVSGMNDSIMGVD